MPRPNAIDSLSSISLAELVKVIVHTVGITDAVDLEIIEAVIKSYLRDNGATSAICQHITYVGRLATLLRQHFGHGEDPQEAGEATEAARVHFCCRIGAVIGLLLLLITPG